MSPKRLADRYSIQEEIGRGALASVWRATDEVLGRTVAVKVLHPHLSEDEGFRKRFNLEALAAAKLAHPNILAVYDTGEQDGVPYLVMEHANESLEDALERGPMLHGQVAALGASICSALAHAHGSGAIHYDIKPSNILFSNGGIPKLGDFGIARTTLRSPDDSITPTQLTTLAYVSPEHVTGDRLDERSDTYSLACVLYEAAAGKPPFPGADLASATARVYNDPPPLRHFRSGTPAGLERVIMRGLAREPADRFDSASDLGRSLFRLSEEQPDGTIGAEVDEARVEGTSFVKAESRWLIPTILLILAGAGLVVGVVRYGERSVATITELLRGDGGGEGGEPLRVTRGDAFDPEGDRSENNPQVQNLYDSDERTTWRTQYYTTAEFGALKSGVGVWFDLGGAREVARVEVVSATPGWSGSVRYSDDGSAWSDAGELSRADKRHSLATPGVHRYWMIWIDRLVETGGPQPFSVTLSEVRIFGK